MGYIFVMAKKPALLLGSSFLKKITKYAKYFKLIDHVKWNIFLHDAEKFHINPLLSFMRPTLQK